MDAAWVDQLATLTPDDLRVLAQVVTARLVALETLGIAAPPAADPADRITLRREYTRCSRAGCHCRSADGPRHGPYWYGYLPPAPPGQPKRQRKVYYGKTPPAVLSPSQLAAGLATVSTTALAFYEELAAAFRQACTDQDRAAARTIAEAMPNPTPWLAELALLPDPMLAQPAATVLALPAAPAPPIDLHPTDPAPTPAEGLPEPHTVAPADADPVSPRLVRIADEREDRFRATIADLQALHGDQLYVSRESQDRDGRWRAYGVIGAPAGLPEAVAEIDVAADDGAAPVGAGALSAGGLVPPETRGQAKDDDAVNGDDWDDEGEDELDDKDWDDADLDDDDDWGDPLYQLQAVRLSAGQKRHLSISWRATLCGRELYGQEKELRGFDRRDCQRCADRAAALHLCCADCQKVLLRGGLSGRCFGCQTKLERDQQRGRRLDAPTAATLTEQRRAAGQVAREQESARRTRKARVEAEEHWRWQRGLLPLAPPRPGDVGAWLDQHLAAERLADALDQRLFGAPSPLPADITAGREYGAGRIRYTFCHAVLGYLGEVIIRPLGGDGLEFRANGAGHVDDPDTPARAVLLYLVAMTLQSRLEDGGPIRALPGVGYCRLTGPAYQPLTTAQVGMLPCPRCQQPLISLIYAEPGHLFADYARDLFPTYRAQAVPTYVASPLDGDGPDEAVFGDLQQLWPTRGSVERLSLDAFNQWIETLSRVHCNA